MVTGTSVNTKATAVNFNSLSKHRQNRIRKKTAIWFEVINLIVGKMSELRSV